MPGLKSKNNHPEKTGALSHSVPRNKNVKAHKKISYSFEKSCLSHKFFVTLSSVAVSRQKGKADAIPPLMRASRKAYGSNSFFQTFIKLLYHH